MLDFAKKCIAEILY